MTRGRGSHETNDYPFPNLLLPASAVLGVQFSNNTQVSVTIWCPGDDKITVSSDMILSVNRRDTFTKMRTTQDIT